MSYDHKEYQRKYHQKHRKKLAMDNATWRINKKKEVLRATSQECCSNCGENRAWLLQFHHVNPDNKEFSIGPMLCRLPMEQVIHEAQKCVVLCANCHADYHYSGPRDI